MLFTSLEFFICLPVALALFALMVLSVTVSAQPIAARPCAPWTAMLELETAVQLVMTTPTNHMLPPGSCRLRLEMATLEEEDQMP